MTLRTEEEARQTACCRTLCADIWSNPRENEGENRTISTPCIASQCMAWRSIHEYYHQRPDGAPPAGPGWQQTTAYPKGGGEWERTVGYCGLAGSPS